MNILAFNILIMCFILLIIKKITTHNEENSIEENLKIYNQKLQTKNNEKK